MLKKSSMLKKTRVVQNRHRARELAVQLLYSLGIRPDRNARECVDAFISEGGFAFEESAEIKEYLSFLVEGTWEKRFDIDNKMRMVVTGWRPEHMVAVDRAVLRLAIFEGFLTKEVPLAVAISEAVELARAFGTEESGKFVNGVLGKMARDGEKTSGKTSEKTSGNISIEDGKYATDATAAISTDR
ncbi:MAG: transcription antitermination factor NusB [Synergistaceae bacterium]|jgi:N utilization substance protein B|nr:transcription antitermination factor NusB [Synergistaceae bacterium]